MRKIVGSLILGLSIVSLGLMALGAVQQGPSSNSHAVAIDFDFQVLRPFGMACFVATGMAALLICFKVMLAFHKADKAATAILSASTALILTVGSIMSSSPVSDINAPSPTGIGLVTREMGIDRGTIRSVTAYNVGDPRQTHSKPCFGANGDNLCKLVEKGIKVCAANFVPLGSKLYVDQIGECIVLDRMNTRFPNRVDLAMKKSNHHLAVKFGVQRLNVIRHGD
jgi:3D (Asp-Asp-Asp) domain-containing protein